MQRYNTHFTKSSVPERFYVSGEFADFSRNLRFDSGFALPSVLFLLVILTTLALSLLSISYFEKRVELTELYELQAEHAAQSGIAHALSKYSTPSSSVAGQQERFEFPNGSYADVHLLPWGALYIAESIGSSHRIQVKRQCLVAQELTEEFSPALILANPNHSLVMTGSSHITGEVIVGAAGVSTGTLRDYTVPSKIPVTGKITKQQRPELPAYNQQLLDSQREFFDALIGGKAPAFLLPGLTIREKLIDLSTIPDSVQLITATGNVVLAGALSRRSQPLFFAIRGSAKLTETVNIEDLVAICSEKEITALPNSKFETGILYSRDSIAVFSSLSGQIFAPSITIESGSYFEYPTFLISIPHKSRVKQKITLESNSKVEGMLMLLSEVEANYDDHIINIHDGATVIGAVFCQGRMTMDGTVTGAVLTKDFYFYEAPTHYLGWLRIGIISREELPMSFMTPPGFSKTPLLGILEWI